MLILPQLFGFQMKPWLYGDSFSLCTKETLFLKILQKQLFVCVGVYMNEKKNLEKVNKNVNFLFKGQAFE